MAEAFFQPQETQKRISAPVFVFLCSLIFWWPSKSEAAEKHWAFVPPTREDDRNIDWFIEQRFAAKNIVFSKEANRLTLGRRLALTLTGLPLRPERARAFVEDPNPRAYERLVDELLASQRFGEHQARYWLDAVRYADTHGLHMDNRRAIFPYRDWVIRAFNANLPLNHFIQWQVAGDLYGDSLIDRKIATGFIRLNPTTGEDGSLYEEFQAVNTFDRIETLGTALLGMTLSCARCHDHKYDPISQKEYFRLFAYFNNTSEPSLDDGVYRYEPVIMVPKNSQQRQQLEVLRRARAKPGGLPARIFTGKPLMNPGWNSTNWLVSRVQPADESMPPRKRRFTVRGLPGQSHEDLPDSIGEARWVTFSLQLKRDRVIWLRYRSGPGHELLVDDLIQTNRSRFVPLALKQGSHSIAIKVTGTPDKEPLEVVLHDSVHSKISPTLLLTEQEQSNPKALPQLEKLAAIEDQLVPTLSAEERTPVRVTRVLKRGQYDRPIGDPLLPGIPEVFSSTKTALPTNRLGLAQWLVARDNPLVARVLVNRLWQQVFGEGLVRTPEDFGTRGEPPTHPGLLDWLAIELIDSGWNMKHVLKLMVTSRTFRQQSLWRKDVDDPENRLWIRGPRHRLDAEVLRDVGLWAGGILDQTMGGEGVKPWQPAGLWKALAHPMSNTRIYEPDPDELSYRRSIYLYWKRSSPHPMMTLFDAPTREASCVRRSRGNTAAQSLALLNERQRVQMAKAIAKRLITEKNDHARIQKLYWLLTGRSPRDSELQTCTTLLKNLGNEIPWPKLVIIVMASDAAITLN